MIVNKQGQVVANVAQPTVVFKSKDAYDAWVASLPSAECEKNFIVIKTYEVAAGGVYEVDTLLELQALDLDHKINETVYLVREDNSGWRWDIPAEEEHKEASWVQLWGPALVPTSVITVETYDDLDTVTPKAEDIVYIVKDENALYRYNIDTETPLSGHFEKVGGGVAEAVVPVADTSELDPTVIPAGEMVYVTEYQQFFQHDEDTAEDKFYTIIEDHTVYADEPTPEEAHAGDLYIDKNAEGETVVKIVTETGRPDDTSDYEMPLEEFKTGIIFDDVHNVAAAVDILVAEDILKLVVDGIGIYAPYKFNYEAAADCHAFKRMNSHGGNIGYYLVTAGTDFDKFPVIGNLTAEEKAATFVDLSDGDKAYCVFGLGTGVSPYKYQIAGKGEQEQEVITVSTFAELPAIPSKGVIYIVEQTNDGALAGVVKIANPAADFTQPASEENIYYLDVGTDITALQKRIEELENIADDVVVVPSYDSLLGRESKDNKDKLFITEDLLEGWTLFGEGTPEKEWSWQRLKGARLDELLPTLTMEEWMGMSEEERPVFANIVAYDDEGNPIPPFMDGFSYTVPTT